MDFNIKKFKRIIISGKDIFMVTQQEERKAPYEIMPDYEGIKIKIEQNQIELRKKKRSEHISKKRALLCDNKTVAHDASTDDLAILEFDISQVPISLSAPNLGLSNPSLTPTDRVLLLINLIKAYDTSDILQPAVETLRKIMSCEKGFHLKIISETGVSQKLIKCIRSDNPTLQFDST